MNNIFQRAMLFFILIFFSIAQAQEPEPTIAKFAIYQNIWEVIYSCYQEPIERCFVITWWGDMYSYTTGEEKRISNIPMMIEFLKGVGVEVSDIALIVHNHWGFARPSQENGRTYKYLKNLGFEGAFVIFSTSLKVIYIERNDMRRYLTTLKLTKRKEKK